MIKADMIPDEVWTQVALRLESAGYTVPNSVAKLVAAEVINAWPGAEWLYVSEPVLALPLPQEARDE